VVDADERTIHNLGPNYPSGHATENEDVYIEEREYYLGWSSQYEAQKERKLANLSWLEERRKYVWNCAEGNVDDVEPGWNISHREERYDNLQIATHYGSAWDEWQEENSGGGGSSGGNWRDKSASWHEHHLGLTESPADSNCDSRSDGIRTSQDGCANGTWLRYQPWCGCWAWSGLYAAGKVKKGDSWLASVASIEDYAKAGRGPFKGWTTDGSKAKKGDLVVLFGRGQHVGTIRSTDANYAYTWEGNTSSGSSGSQSNGGGSYKRSRSRSGEVLRLRAQLVKDAARRGSPSMTDDTCDGSSCIASYPTCIIAWHERGNPEQMVPHALHKARSALRPLRPPPACACVRARAASVMRRATRRTRNEVEDAS
jgi:hypothetical protein